MKQDYNQTILFYNKYIYPNNPLFSNSYQQLEDDSEINRLNKIIDFLNKNNVRNQIKNIMPGSENIILRSIATFSNCKEELDSIKDCFIPQKPFVYKYISDELYLMACIRAGVLNMNFPGALTACKLSGKIFDITDSLALPSGEYSWWARASKDNISYLAKFLPCKFNDDGEINIRSTLFEISDEIFKAKGDDKFRKIILSFCALASDENFQHVVNENNSNLLNNYFSSMLTKDISSIKSHILSIENSLKQKEPSKNSVLTTQKDLTSKPNLR